MTAVITDVRYRMSVSVIRDLSRAGIRVIACESESCVNDPKSPPLGFFSRCCAQAVALPPEHYFDALFALCEQTYRAEGEKPALLPVGAATQAFLAQDEVRSRFSAVAGLCLPTTQQLAQFNDKSAVHELARQLGIPVPKSARADSAAGWDLYPCVVKPLCGEAFCLTAAQRYIIAQNRQQADEAIRHFMQITGETPLLQEYLPGDGYGCSVMCQDGNIACSLGHHRLREYPVSGGPSSCCESVHDTRMLKYAEQMVQKTAYTGPAMFEFKADAAGQPRLLEINPRIWGSYPLTRAAGSGMSAVWFALAYNAGNPASPINDVVSDVIIGKKMRFFPSDLAAGISYIRKGQPARGLKAFHPFLRDGLFEWRDMMPALCYYRSLLARPAPKKTKKEKPHDEG